MYAARNLLTYTSNNAICISRYVEYTAGSVSDTTPGHAGQFRARRVIGQQRFVTKCRTSADIASFFQRFTHGSSFVTSTFRDCLARFGGVLSAGTSHASFAATERWGSGDGNIFSEAVEHGAM